MTWDYLNCRLSGHFSGMCRGPAHIPENWKMKKRDLSQDKHLTLAYRVKLDVFKINYGENDDDVDDGDIRRRQQLGMR